MPLAPYKRPCFDVQNPLPFDALLEALLSASDCDSSHLSLALHQILLRHPCDSDRLRLLERSLALASHLQDAAYQLSREHASVHNSLTWSLTHDLTIQVFSLLGMHSLGQAAASCSLFHKVAMESACYRDVDLTGQSLRVNNRTVARIIERAGQHLRSLKLGSLPCQKNAHAAAPKVFTTKPLGEPQTVDADKRVLLNLVTNDQRVYSLSKSCLEPLIAKNRAVGTMLETLHLFNIEEMDSKNLCKVIAACPGLTDLEFVGLCINARVVLNTVTCHCHDLKRLCFEPQKRVEDDWHSCSRTVSCTRIVHGCPNILSLALRGFKLPDHKVNILLKGLPHLMEVDFSEADSLTGSFLRDLIDSGQQQLQSFILRNCIDLQEREVQRFLFSLSTGECKSLRYLDVSSHYGLTASFLTRRRSFGIRETAVSCVRKDRPDLELFADFPDDQSSSSDEALLMTSSFGDSDDTGPSPPSSIFEEALSAGSTSSTSGSSRNGSDSSDEDEE